VSDTWQRVQQQLYVPLCSRGSPGRAPP
jgi:hypothetical protein